MDTLSAFTRRAFLGRTTQGLGAVALASLLKPSSLHAASRGVLSPLPLPQKAKRVIWLTMAGGPSQLELFDYKPKLAEMNGKPIPPSFIEGKRFAFMDSSFKDRVTLLGSKREFKQHGQSGAWVSEMLPYT